MPEDIQEHCWTSTRGDFTLPIAKDTVPTHLLESLARVLLDQWWSQMFLNSASPVYGPHWSRWKRPTKFNSEQYGIWALGSETEFLSIEDLETWCKLYGRLFRATWDRMRLRAQARFPESSATVVQNAFLRVPPSVPAPIPAPLDGWRILEPAEAPLD